MRYHTPLIISFFVTCWAICAVINLCYAQITFERTYGDGENYFIGTDVQQTEDQGYIIAGYWELVSFGRFGTLLVKTDSLGNTLWWLQSDPPGLAGFFSSVRQTLDGGYIVGGHAGVTKVDALGGREWSAGAGPILCVQETTDGWYIAVGDSLVRVDASGNQHWTKDCGGRAYFVIQTQDTGYAMTGERDDSIYVLKTSPSGDSLWLKKYGYGIGYSIRQTADGGYAVGGRTGTDMCLVRTDSIGNTLWKRTYGGSAFDVAYSALYTTSGDHILVGRTSSFGVSRKLYLVKTDSLGDTLLTRLYGGDSSAEGRGADLTSDGGYIITGVAGIDLYLIKIDENGLTGIDESSSGNIAPVSNVRLLQNRPNPFHSSTLILYSLPLTTHLTLSIYDITGRLVEMLVNETQQPGIHQVRWNRKTNLSGVYFYRLSAGEFEETRKMVVVE